MSFTGTLDVLSAAISTTFTQNHGYMPYDWQSSSTKRLLQVAAKAPTRSPTLVVLSQPTGGGKSSVRDVVGLMIGGIILTIVPLLGLSADQKTKLLAIKLKDPHRVHAYNLDELQDSATNTALRQELESYDPESNGTVFVFTSPQKLANSRPWQTTLWRLIAKDSIRLVCIDEAHLYASFGVEFRSEFYALHAILFEQLKLKRPKNINVPVLLMTATASQSMINDITALSGVHLTNTNNVIWPNDVKRMSRRNVGIHISFDDQGALRKIKSVLNQMFSTGIQSDKMIVYTNSLKRSKMLKKLIKRHLIQMEFNDVDVVLVHGKLFKEQKFHNTDTMVGPDLSDTITSRDGNSKAIQ
jgi:superfamily II DNA helicase RecQ